MRFRAMTGAVTLATLVAVCGTVGADEIKLSGCLVRGQDGEGYLMINVPGDAAWQRPGDAIVAPGPVGTSGIVASILYWLEKKDGLDDHVGHHIEIEGRLQGELQDGHLTVTPKEQWNEIEVEADGKTLKARVPRTVLIIPDNGDRKLDVLVRRVEPRGVRMLAAECRR